MHARQDHYQWRHIILITFWFSFILSFKSLLLSSQGVKGKRYKVAGGAESGKIVTPLPPIGTVQTWGRNEQGARRQEGVVCTETKAT